MSSNNKKINRKPSGIKNAATATPKELASFIIEPGMHAAFIVDAFNAKVASAEEVGVRDFIRSLKESNQKLSKGDLSDIPGMLLSQAIALQTMFSSLSLKAIEQTQLPQYDAIMRLALKAQSQSRATLAALSQHLSPKHVAFVKQANIAHGPQQVNNQKQHAQSFEKNIEIQPNELLTETTYEQPQMDIRAKTEAA
jgi:hypothetical protein